MMGGIGFTARRLLTAASVVALSAGGAHATTIISGTDGWNSDNVAEGETLDGGLTPTFNIYDRDVTGGTDGAETNGRVLVDAEEGVVPEGIKVMNGPDQGDLGTTTLDGFPGISSDDNTSNCIMASSPTWCDGPRRTGKRWKQQITNGGPVDGVGSEMDLVFNLDLAADPGDPETGETQYRAFHRLINATGVGLDGFVVELGHGVGDDFVASTAGDGLRLTPRDAQNPTQFPFGLFGEDRSISDSGRLGGFFDPTGRALFDTTFSEDSIASGGLLGLYDEFFGNAWVSADTVPDGLLFDHDANPDTDALVMAFFNEEYGQWEQRRFIDSDGNVRPLARLLDDPLLAGELYDNVADVDLDLGLGDFAWELDGETFFVEGIEDLANLNLNYYVYVGEAWQQDTFTLRVSTSSVPVPAALPLLGAAVGGLALMRRRRKAA